MFVVFLPLTIKLVDIFFRNIAPKQIKDAFRSTYLRLYLLFGFQTIYKKKLVTTVWFGGDYEIYQPDNASLYTVCKSLQSIYVSCFNFLAQEQH